jgi:hypothetical protein
VSQLDMSCARQWPPGCTRKATEYSQEATGCLPPVYSTRWHSYLLVHDMYVYCCYHLADLRGCNFHQKWHCTPST